MSKNYYRLYDTSTSDRSLLLESDSLIDIFIKAYGLYDFLIQGHSLNLNFPHYCESCCIHPELTELNFYNLVSQLLTSRELDIYKKRFRFEV